MKNLSLNIIPFTHPNESLSFGFITEKRDGYFPVHRSTLPRVITKDHWDDFNDTKYLYSNFKDTIDCDYIGEVDFYKDNKFVKHYYSQLILEYFRDKAAVVDYNFVNDVEIWFKDKTLTKPKYQGYQKFTIKVHFSKIAKGPALLVSYDGISKASSKSLEELEWPTNSISKVFCEGSLYKFRKLPSEIKQNLDKIYPLLSVPKQVELKIDTNKEPFANRYLPYQTKIKQLYGKYLNTDEFKDIIQHDGKGFFNIPIDQVNRTTSESNMLQFATKSFVDPKEGMKHGPYKSSIHDNVRFFFIYHKPDRKEYVTKLYNYLKNGVKTYFPPLARHIKQPIHFDDGTSLAFESPVTALHELKTHLINLQKIPDTRYVAIYVSPIHKEADEHNELYFQFKEELLKHQITSQVIYKESINNNYFATFMANIAPALLAKIDGIPWRLESKLQPQLIVGIGAFKSNQLNRRYIGSAFCFNNKGEFKGFDCLLDNELDLLAQKIEKKILNFFVDHGQHADKLVIHYYKPFSTRELDPIRKTLEKLGLTIPIVVVTINKTESSDFIAFDNDSKDLMPVSGTYFEIMTGKFILFNNARHNPELASPRIKHFPVKLSLFCTDDDYFNDSDNIKEVIDQVYQFSRMYWKSVRQQNLPVTIKYPEMVAKIFPFFEGDKIPDFGKNNLWFL